MVSWDPELSVDTLGNLLKSKDNSVKKQCLEYVLLLTANAETCKLLYENSGFLKVLFEAAGSNDNDVCGLIFDALINISSFLEGASAIFEADLDPEGISKCTIVLIKLTLDQNNPLSERTAKVLTNMTISEDIASRIAIMILSNKVEFSLAFQAVHNKNFNLKGAFLSPHICQLFGNLAQSLDFQKYLLSAEDGHLFCSILPVLNNGETLRQRRGIASTIYNCLFSSENHLLMLNTPFNILGYLLFPLAGPEEFEDYEVDKMPIEVQYLESDKEREEDPEVRKLLLKSLLMLCSTKSGRLFLRERQAYLILREYHKWEKDSSILLACENVVDILIRTEEEIGIDDLKSVNVPEDLKEKFEKMDHDFMNDT